MDGFKDPFHKFFTQVVFARLFENTGKDFFPTVGLENGNIVLFFVHPDLFNDFHPVGKSFHDGVVQGIYFFSEFFDDQRVVRVIGVFFPDN